jgi:hypothetical protein
MDEAILLVDIKLYTKLKHRLHIFKMCTYAANKVFFWIKSVYINKMQPVSLQSTSPLILVKFCALYAQVIIKLR